MPATADGRFSQSLGWAKTLANRRHAEPSFDTVGVFRRYPESAAGRLHRYLGGGPTVFRSRGG